MALTTTGDAPVNVGSSSLAILVSVTNGMAPVTSESSNRAVLVSIAKGTAPVNSGSSSRAISVSIGKGLAPVNSTSSSNSYLSHNLEPYPGEAYGISIPVELAGLMDPIFPPPTPPVNFAGLPNPTVAPTLTPSRTGTGHLSLGSYRYRYAAWKGTPSQATAPSPSADITLTSASGDDFMDPTPRLHVWTEDDITGDGTARPDLPDGLWKNVGLWTPEISGPVTIPDPGDDGMTNERDYIIYEASDVTSWGIRDGWGYWWGGPRPAGEWRSFPDDWDGPFTAGTTYVMAIYAWDFDYLDAVGRSFNYTPLRQALGILGNSSINNTVNVSYPAIEGADGYLVYREDL